MYAAAEERGLPVMFHTGSSIFPTSRNQVWRSHLPGRRGRRFPRLNIVLAHSGRGLVRTCRISGAHQAEVFLEISGIPPHRLLEYLPAVAHIPER